MREDSKIWGLPYKTLHQLTVTDPCLMMGTNDGPYDGRPSRQVLVPCHIRI